MILQPSELIWSKASGTFLYVLSSIDLVVHSTNISMHCWFHLTTHWRFSEPLSVFHAVRVHYEMLSTIGQNCMVHSHIPYEYTRHSKTTRRLYTWLDTASKAHPPSKTNPPAKQTPSPSWKQCTTATWMRRTFWKNTLTGSIPSELAALTSLRTM